MPVVFRDAAPNDLPALLDLWVASWSEVYGEIDFDARRPWFATHVADWQRDGGFCRLALDGETAALAGFIMLRRTDGLLDQICVDRKRKGDGTARKLLEEARRLSPDGVVLAVNTMNPRAIRFYEREGFVRVGEDINPNSGLPIYRYRWTPAPRTPPA